MGYVVSRGGTFGTVARTYVSSVTNEIMVVIRWGPLGWISPVPRSECKFLSSGYESEAWLEASEWLSARHSADLVAARKKR